LQKKGICITECFFDNRYKAQKSGISGYETDRPIDGKQTQKGEFRNWGIDSLWLRADYFQSQ
jgi:GH15 family glucan-1,4-alpha-glucosidase